MAQRCPQCRATLPAGVEICPTCGTFLKSGLDRASTTRVIFWYSLYILGIAMIPIAIAILLGILCTLIGKWKIPF